MPGVKDPSPRKGGADLIAAAGRILAADGPRGLTVRRLAQEAGTSTMAVYTCFGDKDRLLAELHRIGFERLGSALRQAADAPGPALEVLTGVGIAYRRSALSEPDLYDLMFGRPPPGLAVDPEGAAVADAAYQPLVDCVERCLADGALTGAPAGTIATHLWVVAHGAVSLELGGHGATPGRDPETAYLDAIGVSVVPWLAAPPGRA